jgi:hypothetical protein
MYFYINPEKIEKHFLQWKFWKITLIQTAECYYA